MAATTSLFKRAHHQAVEKALLALNGRLLEESRCYFGGGTAIALRFNEYRESVDIDFLVSDEDAYRNLRKIVSQDGFGALCREGSEIALASDIASDKVSIRTWLQIDNTKIKFEIVSEGRVELDTPPPQWKTCGILMLSPLDMVAEKLLANADRWADDSVFSRDIIDLAAMRLPKNLRITGLAKASSAREYGRQAAKSIQEAVAAVSRGVV